MRPDTFLGREQEIRDAVPADPAKGVQIAVAPVLAVGGMFVAPQTTAGALTAIGLGGLLFGLRGDTPVENTTEGSISRRTEEGDDSDASPGEQGGSDDDSAPDGSSDGDANRRQGRRVRDSSKNERHGDGGRALGKADKMLQEYDRRTKALPRKSRNKLRIKKKRVEQNARKKRRGTEHSRTRKR